MWIAEITDKQRDNEKIRIVVKFTKGIKTIEVDYYLQDQGVNWLDTQIQQKLDTLNNINDLDQQIQIGKKY